MLELKVHYLATQISIDHWCASHCSPAGVGGTPPCLDCLHFFSAGSLTGSNVHSRCLPSRAMGSLGWAPCFVCGWWEYNPSTAHPYARPFCSRCLTELVARRLWRRECYLCGWWNWGDQVDNPVCEYCLHTIARRTRLALPMLPVSVCARIVYWELYIDDACLWQSWPTDDLADRARD